MSDNRKDTIEVMLKIYSGRPNPSWALTERQIAELRVLLEASTEQARKESAATRSLGYTGFVITNHRQSDGIPYRVRVYDGFVAVTVKEQEKKGVRALRGENVQEETVKTTYYTDTHRIESWLLEQAAEHGYAKAIKAMGGPNLHRGEMERR